MRAIVRWMLSRFSRRRSVRLLGAVGTVFVSVVGIVSQWDELEHKPFISDIVAIFRAIPKADPDTLTFAVAHLEGDSREKENWEVRSALTRVGVRGLLLPRKVSLAGAGSPPDIVQEGRRNAQNYLVQCGAHLVLWGSVLKAERELYLTASPHWSGRYWARAHEDLPRLQWVELAPVVRLVAASMDVEFRMLEGDAAADRLRRFFDDVRPVLSKVPSSADERDALSRVKALLAESLLLLAERTGTIEPAQEAEKYLSELARPPERERRAAEENSLAIALRLAGAQAADNAALLKAESLHRKAMSDSPAGSTAGAIIRDSFGVTLRLLGEREVDRHRLEAALTEHNAALDLLSGLNPNAQWQKNQANLLKATAQDNRGVALRLLGERDSTPTWLVDAANAHATALEAWPRDRMPLRRAVVQDNRGVALRLRGEREGTTRWLVEAVKAHDEALKASPRDQAPLQWAMVQDHRGVALRLLGELEDRTDLLDQAVKAHREALGKVTQTRAPLQWATIQDNLGQALQVQAALLQQAGQLDAAANAHHNALKERRRDQVPLQWAATKDHLGGVYSAWARFPEAERAYQEALEERRPDRVPLQWATTQLGLAFVLFRRGADEHRLDLMCRALGMYTDVGGKLEKSLAVSRKSARSAKAAIEHLRNFFGDADAEDCARQYAATLRVMGLTF